MKFYKLTLIAFTVALAACSSTTVNLDSHIQLPAQFEQAVNATGSAEISRWWQHFNDPKLTALVQQGLQANLDIAMAKSRLAEAQAGTHYYDAEQGLNVGGQASAGAGRSRINNPLSGDNITNSTHNQYAAITASWELDFFGKKRSDLDAARATELAAQEQIYAAQMLVASKIAEHYFNIAALQQQSAVLKQSEQTLNQLKRYAQGRFDAGQANANDVLAVESRISAVQAQQATLNNQISANERAIALLTGNTPQGFHFSVDSTILDKIPTAPAGSQPDQLLYRRPDLRAYAAQVQAQAAKLASAKADLYPRFDLQFLGGTGHLDLTTNVSDLKGWAGLVSAGISVPIFTNGRLQANIDAADARLKTALLQYDKGILQALSEVDNAYQNQFALNRQTQLQQKASQQAQVQANNAMKLFNYGEQTLDNALSAKLSALDYQRQLINSKLNRAQNLVGLYKALGGGWEK